MPRSSVPAKPGTYVLKLLLSGHERTALVHVPTGFDRTTTASPLVMVFHGRFGTGKRQEQISRFDSVADRHRFVVAYPDGIGRSWNAGTGVGVAATERINDTAFAFALAQMLVRELRLDPTRIYAAGFSNGASFVHRIACSRHSAFAAIAAVAGTIAPSVAHSCRGHQVSVLQINGTADRISPWVGGQTAGGGTIESVPATVQFWARREGCRTRSVEKTTTTDVSAISYRRCAAGTDVSLYRVDGGGHTWPGGEQYLPRFVIGKTSHFNASEAIWRFFAHHARD